MCKDPKVIFMTLLFRIWFISLMVTNYPGYRCSNSVSSEKSSTDYLLIVHCINSCESCICTSVSDEYDLSTWCLWLRTVCNLLYGTLVKGLQNTILNVPGMVFKDSTFLLKLSLLKVFKKKKIPFKNFRKNSQPWIFHGFHMGWFTVW